MTRIFIGIMICLLLMSCGKKEEKTTEQNFTYIISKENEKYLKELKIKKIPPPPPGFYGYNQIIIDTNNNFYFYQKETIGWHCVQSPSDTIPDFINIEPNDIIKIPNHSLSDFIKENIANKDERHTMLVFASQNDTIKNKDFEKTLDFLNNPSASKIKYFTIRRSTQEEDTVLKYKKNNQPYYSDNIKWDNKRITFPFIKPKLNRSN
ncbi:hypothetical protein IRZ71_00950 [Flavobacterium sp. ANB]|uniref:hypothetical protein n=1 Tax=unclassified Flavobacterium TaxID=196869 RepID=UPI0012B82FC2|nr:MULTISPECIES: hypothetical protein [unclassified Flavobacterium]MBF4514890.1 hypothetical protein [Flavobacterium sp. ANB]MTD68216.1 hypothetical protein [Flavobacterium sp. LC2016-13]